MTEAEALIYFPDGRVELEDVFSEKLFEIKQFLLSRFPNSKIFQGRIEKLRSFQDAFEVLGGTLMKKNSEGYSFDVTLSSVRKTVTDYTIARNALKMSLLRSEDGESIKQVLDNLIHVTTIYASAWSHHGAAGDEDILIGKEPDPMELMNALKEYETDGYQSFKDLVHLEIENPLVKESKRLSLWLKFEQNDN